MMRLPHLSLLTSTLIAALTVSISLSAGCTQDPWRAGERAYFRANYTAALEEWERALVLARAKGDRPKAANILTSIGDVYRNLGQYEHALEYHNQALIIHREIDDRRGEGSDLANIGLVYMDLSQYERALEHLEQALAFHREMGDRRGEGTDLGNIGNLYFYLGQYESALKHLEHALAIRREINDTHGEGADLGNIGNAYFGLGQHKNALEYYTQALAINRERSNTRSEGLNLSNIGVLYGNIGQYDRALEHLEQALAIHRETDHRRGEGANLSNIGIVYMNLGEYERGLDHFARALTIRRETHDRQGEGADLSNLGVAYSNFGQYERALEYHAQALAIRRKIGDRQGEATNLGNIGVVYWNLSQYDRALEHYIQALAIHRAIGDRSGAGRVLGNIGSVYHKLGHIDRSVEHYRQALAIQTEVGAPEILWRVWWGLQHTLVHLQQPDAAIFAGKQAVNTIQGMRGHVQKLEEALQASFIEGKEDVYRGLADLLIEQGRLPEAQFVVGMLKEEEFFDYIRRDTRSADTRDTRIEPTPREREFLGRFETISGRVVALAGEYETLRRKRERSAEEQARLERLEAELNVARTQFLATLDSLEAAFQLAAGERAVDYGELNIKEVEGLKETLEALGPGVVLIHTLSTEETLHVLLTTPHTQVARRSDIGRVELNRLIEAFRERLRSAGSDSQGPAKALYSHLIAPIEEDLEQAKAQTLMVVLDGALRYVPVAALHDGEGYVVERYAVAIFTPAAQTVLKDRPRSDWEVAAFGVSEQLGDFLPLEAVPAELEGIVRRDGQDPDGVLPGVVRLNGAFTEAVFKDILGQGRYPVVHIATHFDFKPGTERDSALLLGDGSLLTLDTIRTDVAFRFRGVDLLTLSACETEVGTKANGIEIEGFGTLAQRQGAKGVLATLWAVADQSTGLLMQALYARRQGEGEVLSKAEALRQAQMALLDGSIVSPTDPNATYRHPYYWAPFILMGNWL